ncbi:hypothetical protein A3768_3508 [Ralstonia solanacearum]|nr:hypothetical protein A3768_3508 [Ralstonia solanacearum]
MTQITDRFAENGDWSAKKSRMGDAKWPIQIGAITMTWSTSVSGGPA